MKKGVRKKDKLSFLKKISFNDLEEKIINWLNKEKIMCFVLTFFTAFICNIYVMTNDLLFADCFSWGNYHISNLWEISLGRWMLHYVDVLRFGVASIHLSSVMAYFALAISSMFIVDLFSIKSKITKIITCLLLAVSPCFSETLLSSFCSFEFTLALCFAVCSIYFTYKNNNKIISCISGAILLSFSLGLYQSYLGVACGLCILIPLKDLLLKNKTNKEVCTDLVKFACMGVLAIILYEIELNIVLRIWHTTMNTYSGANEIGIKTIFTIPKYLNETFVSFKNYFYNDLIINNSQYGRTLVNTVFFACLIMVSISLFIKQICASFKNRKKMKETIVTILLSLILFIVLPVGLGIIELIAVERNINQLMCSQYILIYIFGLSLIQCNFNRYIKFISSFVIIFSLLWIFQTYFVMNNASYMAIGITTRKTEQVAERIINLVESNEDYKLGMAFNFVGNPSGDYFEYNNHAYRLASGIASKNPLIWATSSICNVGWMNFFSYKYGYNITVVNYDTYMNIIDSKEFNEMPIYPSKESVKVIDGIMVIKLTNNPSREV